MGDVPQRQDSPPLANLQPMAIDAPRATGTPEVLVGDPAGAKLARKGPFNITVVSVAATPAATTAAAPAEEPAVDPTGVVATAAAVVETRVPAAPAEPPLGTALMDRLEGAAEQDATISAALVVARADPAAFTAASARDPGISRALAAFFVREMDRDSIIATELANIVWEARAAGDTEDAGDAEASRLVTTDFDNDSRSTCSLTCASSDGDSLG